MNFLKDPSSIIGHHLLQSDRDFNKIPQITDEKSGSEDLAVKKFNIELVSSASVLIVVGVVTIVVTLIYKRKISREFSSTRRIGSGTTVLNPVVDDGEF